MEIKQASTLLDAVGATTLKLIKRATAPRKPMELKFKELIVTIERFLDNAPQSTRETTIGVPSRRRSHKQRLTVPSLTKP